MEEMTLDLIIEKTKRMLGKNYRGNELTDAHSTSEEETEPVMTPEGTESETEPTVDEQVEFDILKDVCEMVIREAAEWTNRKVDTALLNECWPVIVRCSCVAYLNRGAEGLGSQSELGQQNVYNDWITLMHRQITNRRYVI